MTNRESNVLKSMNHPLQALVRCSMDVMKYFSAYADNLQNGVVDGETKNHAAPITFFAATRYRRLFKNMVKEVRDQKKPGDMSEADFVTGKAKEIEWALKRKFYIKKC